MIQYDTIQDSPFPIARPDSKFQPVPCTQIASQKKTWRQHEATRSMHSTQSCLCEKKGR